VLRNTLGALRDVVDFDALGFDLGRRAEEVPVEDFVAVANALPAERIAGSLSDITED
jgi:16S rRNA (adenine1518-N6/adenine1519-N6)-dimethyltransferase